MPSVTSCGLRSAVTVDRARKLPGASGAVSRRMMVRGVDVEDRAAARVLQAGGGLGLPAEPRDSGRVLRQLRREDFDRDRPVQAEVEPAPHLTHAAGADRGVQPVTPGQQ